MRAGARAAFALALVFASTPARADDAPNVSPRVEARKAFDLAEHAAAELDFRAALRGYREVLRIDPSAPFAGVAQARAADLEAHAEGDFAPLAELERVRRDPNKLADRDALEALARDAEGFPDGRVRGEAWLVVGESLFRRFDDAAAARVLSRAVADPAIDELSRSIALSDWVAYLRKHRDTAGALAALDTRPNLLPGLRAEVARELRRERLVVVATVILAALAVIVAAALLRAARRLGDLRALPSALGRPLPIAAALYVGGAGAGIAAVRGGGDPRPFIALGASLAALVVASRALALAGSSSRSARVGRAALCGLGALAAAFLSVAQIEAGYLASFGL